jgi:hypothetical protein
MTATAERLTERQELHQTIDTLPDSAILQLKGYAARLREEEIEEQEEAEDIACIDARKDEPTIPLEDVLKKYESKYGLLA